MRIPITLYSLLAAAILTAWLDWLDLPDPYWSFWCASHADRLGDFCANQHVLRDRALAGDDRALAYLLELTRYTDGATAEFHGGDLADVFIARGDAAMALAIKNQGQESRRAILAVVPGDFSKGSATFDWKNFPKSRALLPLSF